VPRLPNVALVGRLERIRDLSHDLARELARPFRETAAARAIADAIRRDINVVHRALHRSKR
jgi:hypothetical protein